MFRVLNKKSSIVGYKSANNSIIELEINKSTRTNLNRKVINSNHARYRTEIAFVTKIYNKFSRKEINHIESDVDKSCIYYKGKYISVDNYDNNNDIVYTSGIHFYLTFETAFYHNFDFTGYTGEYKTWYASGALESKINYINGLKNGLNQMWYENGKLMLSSMNKDNKLDGLCMRWSSDGVLKYKSIYKNGQISNEL